MAYLAIQLHRLLGHTAQSKGRGSVIAQQLLHSLWHQGGVFLQLLQLIWVLQANAKNQGKHCDHCECSAVCILLAAQMR